MASQTSITRAIHGVDFSGKGVIAANSQVESIRGRGVRNQIHLHNLNFNFIIYEKGNQIILQT